MWKSIISPERSKPVEKHRTSKSLDQARSLAPILCADVQYESSGMQRKNDSEDHVRCPGYKSGLWSNMVEFYQDKKKFDISFKLG